MADKIEVRSAMEDDPLINMYMVHNVWANFHESLNRVQPSYELASDIRRFRAMFHGLMTLGSFPTYEDTWQEIRFLRELLEYDNYVGN